MAVDRTKILAAAQKHLSKGNYDRAIAEYQKLVKADPRDVRTLLKIGDLYTRKGAHREATSTYHKVAEHYAKQGFFLKAVAVYKQILKLQPGRNDVSLRLAEMYENLQLVSDALSTYEQAASAFAREGDIDRALETLGKMAALDPENIPVRIKYAEALSKAGRRDEAGDEFEAGAELLREQGRMDDYVKVAERLLYHRPADANLARTLAELYLQRNDAKRALAKLQLCFKQDPKNVDTLELLARAFHVLGQTPKTVSVYREMARIHQESGRPEERARILKKILELDPNDAEARQALAGFAPSPKKPSRPAPRVESMPPGAVVDSGSGMLLTEDDPELEIIEEADVIEELEDEVIEDEVLIEADDDDDDDIMIVEEDVEIDMGEMEDVEADPRPATSIPPDVAREAQIARLLTECDVFARYGLKSKVITQLEQVITLAPEHVEARERLKDAYIDAGRPADAAAQLRALAEIFSDKPQVAQMYERRAQELLQTPSMAPPPADDDLVIIEEDPEPSSDYADIDEDESDVTLFVDDPLGELDELEAEVADLPTTEEDDDLIFVDDPIEVSTSTPAVVEDDTLMMEEDDDILFIDDQEEETAKGPRQPAAVKDLRIDDQPSAQSEEIPPPDPMGVVLTEEMGLPEPVAPTDDADDDFGVPDHTVIDTSLRIPMGTQPGVPDIAASLEAPISPDEFEAAPVSESSRHVEEARERLSIPPGEIEETLDEADFFLAQGLFDAAQATIEDAISANPNHPLLRDKLQEITEARSNAASSQLPPAPTEPQDEAFALAEKLAEELGADDVEDLSGSDVLDVDSVFEQFKKGVEEQIGLEDTDTHFDLGIAYKEMGLLDDAVHEFELAMSNPQRECICHTMIGLCRAEQGRLTDAIGHFKKGLYAETKTEREELGLYYELGSCLRAASMTPRKRSTTSKKSRNAHLASARFEARIKALSEPEASRRRTRAFGVGRR